MIEPDEEFLQRFDEQLSALILEGISKDQEGEIVYKIMIHLASLFMTLASPLEANDVFHRGVQTMLNDLMEKYPMRHIDLQKEGDDENFVA